MENERKMSSSLLDTPANSHFQISSAFIMGESSISSRKSRFDLLVVLNEGPHSMESSQSVKWEKQAYLLSKESLLAGRVPIIVRQ